MLKEEDAEIHDEANGRFGNFANAPEGDRTLFKQKERKYECLKFGYY